MRGCTISLCNEIIIHHVDGMQLIGVRTIPWAKAHLNYTAQALIISAGSSGFKVYVFMLIFISILFNELV